MATTISRTVTQTLEPAGKAKQSTPAVVNASVQVKPLTSMPQKKVSRRSSKPILNWFQRKLAGGPKGRRASDSSIPSTVLAEKPKNGATGRSGTRAQGSSPLAPPSTFSGRRQAKVDKAASNNRRKTISLNGDGEGEDRPHSDDEDLSTYRSSLARDSMWSPTSAMEADEDASVRPLPPSSPPSPSPSHSSASYLSGPHTFRSMGGSTKQTTVLSVDLTPYNGAHIAQAPPTPIGHGARFPHIRTHSTGAGSLLGGAGGSITFSALPPPSPQSSLGPSSTVGPDGNALQAPLHTSHHPRNNPRPSSPPNDDASMLTLASSAFGVLGPRAGPGPVGGGWNSANASARGGTDSISHFGGGSMMTGDRYLDAENISQYLLGDDERLDRDVDASVRALRPRSSRRGSWASEASGWSASAQGLGTSLARKGSLWTTNSARSGEHTNGENQDSAEPSEFDASPEKVALPPSATGSVDDLSRDEELAQTPPAVGVSLPLKEERRASSDTMAQAYARQESEVPPLPAKSEDIIVHAPASILLPSVPVAPNTAPSHTLAPAIPTQTVFYRPENNRSVVESPAGTEQFYSVTSTPMAT